MSSSHSLISCRELHLFLQPYGAFRSINVHVRMAQLLQLTSLLCQVRSIVFFFLLLFDISHGMAGIWYVPASFAPFCFFSCLGFLKGSRLPSSRSSRQSSQDRSVMGKVL